MSNKGTCKAQDCGKDVHAKGYCDQHYRKWRKGVMGKPRYNTCHTEGCRKRRARRGLCEEHHAKEYSGKKTAETAAS